MKKKSSLRFHRLFQAWGVMEARAGQLEAARELFQQGVWSAPPRDRNVALLFQVSENTVPNPQVQWELSSVGNSIKIVIVIVIDDM